MAEALSSPTAQSQQQDTQKSTLRRPRGLMRVQGEDCSVIRFTVENKGHFSADTWIAEIEPWQHPEAFGLPYWADVEPGIRVELLAGFLDPKDPFNAKPSVNLTSLILGEVDDIEIDPNTSKLLLSGRDLTSRLIDRKTSNRWTDHTASWVVESLAKLVGLKARVTATKTPVGQYYSHTHSAIKREIPYWDMVCFLAQQEGFDAYVKGEELYFGPPESINDPNPYIIECHFDGQRNAIWSTVKDVKLHRTLTLANDITVTVISHSTQTGKSIKVQASRAGVKGGQSSRTSGGRHQASLPSKTKDAAGAESTLRNSSVGAQNYTYTRSNLTQEQAEQMANSVLDDLSKWERTFEVEDAGDPTLSIRRKAIIRGTDSSFDNSYFIYHVRHTLDYNGGMHVYLGGKNHPIESNPVVT